MLQQELQNAQTLEQLAQRETQAAQTIQNALHGHQLAMQQLQQISYLCNQVEVEMRSNTGSLLQTHNSQPFSNPFAQH